MLKCERGQAAVEFALVLPVLLLLVMGIFEFGRIFFSYLVISEMAREGARYGVVGHTNTEIESHIESLNTALDPARLVITVTPPDANRGRGGGLTVAVDYSVDLVAPLVGAVLPDPFPLAASCTMREE